MAVGGNISINGKRYDIHYFTGKVVGTQKSKETKIHGSGGNNRSVSISSETIDHHEFFLSDANGKEESFKMIDWDFPCREGHTLTVLWVRREGKKTGPIFAVLNHNTDERHVLKPKAIASLFKTPLWLQLVLLHAAVGAAWWLVASVGITVAVGIGVLWFFGLRSLGAAKRFLKSTELQELEATLA
jgi:hypothetical protein